MILSKGENSIQITRQILSKSLNYFQNDLFSFLSNSHQITDSDLFNYLLYKNISSSKIESKLLILFYDKDMDNKLSFDEFKQFLKYKQSLNNYFLTFNDDAINEDIEFLFDKILQKEIELGRKFYSELKKLKTRNDFEIHKVFHYITKLGFINKLDIQKFLKQNHFDFLDGDIKNIIKRLDINKDGIIDIKEFSLLFDFPKSIKSKYRYISCNKCREFRDKYIINKNKLNIDIIKSKTYKFSPNIRVEKQNNRYEENFEIQPMSLANHRFHYVNDSSNKNYNINSPFNKDSKKYNSQQKDYNFNLNLIRSQDLNKNIFGSINNIHNSDIINNIKSAIYMLRNKKHIEGNKRYNISPKNYFNPNVKSERVTEIDYYINSNHNFFEKFNNLLKLIMRLELEIEKEKINFIKDLKVPFRKIYSIFDEDNKGYINEKELKDGFYKLKIIDEEGYDIFLKRYDVFQMNKIEESDFFDIVVPFEKCYRKYVEKKLKNKYLERNYNIIEDTNTVSCLKNLFSFIINKEKEINNYKINFIDKNNNSIIINELFDNIDKNKKGFFSFEDLKLYLEKNNLISDDYATALLYIRLDKMKKGIIELEDLMKEL